MVEIHYMAVPSSKLPTVGQCQHSLTSSSILKPGIGQARSMPRIGCVSIGNSDFLECPVEARLTVAMHVETRTTGKNVTFVWRSMAF